MKRDLNKVIIEKLCMCLEEYELRFCVYSAFCEGNITFVAGNIFSLVKSGMVLILLKHYDVSSPFCVPIQPAIGCPC